MQHSPIFFVKKLIILPMISSVVYMLFIVNYWGSVVTIHRIYNWKDFVCDIRIVKLLSITTLAYSQLPVVILEFLLWGNQEFGGD